ncbi:RNA methyltransferase, TrmA family, putative [Eimeria mitis]|uniref:RNA methyltransferase, TrmA family, putative n=1 Tax=Eimeria mitis TaxID=44415 RepID=U6KKG6_9EIME|nr:RNA methyltransferase, TrmA family, putative [Eimeria mitis]CDJ35933.1 RNA methyltransferase, TrmA family, putative [Eimeria mitis]
MGPLNVVHTAEEGDILRGGDPYVDRGRSLAAAAAALGPPTPGQRASPCPHFLEGCGGCQFLHLDSLHQRTAKQQLVQQLLQELQCQQQLHQQQHSQQQRAHWEPPTVTPLVPASSDRQFAARADMLLQLVEGRPRLGLPAFDGSSSIVSVQDCIRLRGPLREVYTCVREVLLPLLESRRLRILDHRCGAGTLSGLTLRLAGDCPGGDGKVLLRLKGHLESNVRPRLVHLAETLSERCPALKAVTFYDVSRPHSPDEILFGADALVVSVFGRRFRITGGTRETVFGRGDSLQQIWPAVEEAAGGATGRLWGALGSGGFFEILLSFRFKEVVVFASGARDAEETQRNMSLNELYRGEVVQCTNSSCVAGAFAARAGFYGPLRLLQRSPQLQQGNAAERNKQRLRKEEMADEVEATDDSADAASAAAPTATGAGEFGTIVAGAPHFPDVLLLSPSRGGLPKASKPTGRSAGLSLCLREKTLTQTCSTGTAAVVLIIVIFVVALVPSLIRAAVGGSTTVAAAQGGLLAVSVRCN